MVKSGKLVISFAISLFLCASMSGSLLAAPSQQTPSSEPIFKINAKNHVASIRKIRSDAKGTYLVTASYDQTVKVWDVFGGDLLATLHPPIGEGNEGKLYAVAVSSDGRSVATGGFTGKSWDGQFAVYVFDWQTGKMVRRLSGLPQPVLDLAYSADGRFLAVALAKNQGIRIYGAEDYSVLMEDFQYSGSVYGLDFDNKGKLVTVSDDGFIRLYNSNHVLTLKKQTSSKAPYSVSFSPDGSLIAVGYMDVSKVDVFSSEDLKLLYSPSTKGITNGNLSSVGWLDNERLCAGGRWSISDGTNPVRCWDGKGKGSYVDIPTKSRDTILSMEGLPGAQLAFASGEASFGVIGKNNQVRFFHPPVSADFRDKQSEFMVNEDGSEVVFTFYWSGVNQKALFSIRDRYLEINPKKLESFRSPITSGLPVKNWQNSDKLMLGGKSLNLDPYERSYCMAVSPDKQGFVIGSEWALRYFDGAGNIKWKVTTPAPVRTVNITSDRRLAIAGYADGTIRWHRLRDGVLVLTLFVLPDTEQWVMWSPSGYYDASAGADQIIGWHINRGSDKEADFFPVSRFRSVYYRPDLSVAILKTLDEREALKFAEKEWGRNEKEAKPQDMLPPVVRLLSPPKEYKTNDQEIKLKFSMRSPKGAPINTVKIFRDGRPVKVEEGHWEAEEEITREVTVALPRKDTVISVIAINRFAASEPAMTKIAYEDKPQETVVAKADSGETISRSPIQGGRQKGIDAPPSADTLTKPKLYILAIGVGKYKQEDMRLLFPAKDAKDFVNVMSGQKGELYRDVEAKVIVDEEATKDKIMEGLEWISNATTANDVAMIFMAGHGMTDNKSGTYYFMPVEGDPERLMTTGVPASYIQDTAKSINGKVILFLDACYSANILKSKTRGIPTASTTDVSGVVNELTKAENGLVVFASSSKTQKSLESEDWGNGAFTKAIITGLEGKSSYVSSNKITITMLKVHVMEEVKKLTKGQQSPIVQIPLTSEETDRDFPIAIKKGV